MKKKQRNPKSALIDSGQEPAAVYARMSDDQQRKASIDDQIRNCHEMAEEKSWSISKQHTYCDEGKTGTTMFDRPGFAALRAAYKRPDTPFRRIIIDDTSRMGRNEADVHRVLDELEYYGIHIYFASDGLDSQNPWFRDAFSAKARQDAQFSKTHGKRVRRGRIGLFEKGLNPGWTCYGYRNVPLHNETNPDARGRAATLGMKEEIDTEEARIVVLIYMWYSQGLSLRQIVVRLNTDRMPPPRKCGRKIKSCSWARSAVDYILKNERYRGILVYGRTTQIRNPENGKMTQRRHPEREWRRSCRPELRIVDEDLWGRVNVERTRRSCVGLARAGGLNRTDKSRTYFLSGLLECGVCGANYNLRSHGRYSCSNYMWRDGCSNSATFRREDVERSLISALSNKLRSPELRESLAKSVFTFLKSEKARSRQSHDHVGSRKAQLESALKVEEGRRDNLVHAIAVGGDMRSLVDALAGSESEIEVLAQKLAELTPPTTSKDARFNEIRKFVDRHTDSFEQILLGAAEALKIEFQRRISPALTVTPVDEKEGRVFCVTGGIGLFSPAEGEMLSEQVNQIGQHCTIPIDIKIPLCVLRKRKSSERVAHAAKTSPQYG
ncbi:DNA invertase Pin-like site-specific DNA recombinase [Silvibacterium bohemicum]|uniref:DNA invertase Pin-like site-specific DNA recombinase n=1 Tax=Silvibacterium bohemicum TaxID=1577686 RepID=A0A841K2F8_9BACT|nr:recombinase family protein [Silvibacterium bohemicum]MBB6147195.1 DNA invertase Pin-like site-specific DNA recombinase [Silvibacterium bohemicum]